MMALEQEAARQGPRRVTILGEVKKDRVFLLVSRQASGETSQMTVTVRDNPHAVEINHRDEHFVTFKVGGEEGREMVLPLSHLGVGRGAPQEADLQRWLVYPNELQESS
jgi:hypothetical protein